MIANHFVKGNKSIPSLKMGELYVKPIQVGLRADRSAGAKSETTQTLLGARDSLSVN